MQQTGDEMFSRALTHITWYLKMPLFFSCERKGDGIMKGCWKTRGDKILKKEKNVELQGCIVNTSYNECHKITNLFLWIK